MNFIKRRQQPAADTILYMGCSLTDRGIKQYLSKDDIDTSEWYATVYPCDFKWMYNVQRMNGPLLKIYDSGSHRSRSQAIDMARRTLEAAQARDEFESQPWRYLQ